MVCYSAIVTRTPSIRAGECPWKIFETARLNNPLGTWAHHSNLWWKIQVGLAPSSRRIPLRFLCEKMEWEDEPGCSFTPSVPATWNASHLFFAWPTVSHHPRLGSVTTLCGRPFLTSHHCTHSHTFMLTHTEAGRQVPFLESTPCYNYPYSSTHHSILQLSSQLDWEFLEVGNISSQFWHGAQNRVCPNDCLLSLLFLFYLFSFPLSLSDPPESALPDPLDISCCPAGALSPIPPLWAQAQLNLPLLAQIRCNACFFCSYLQCFCT